MKVTTPITISINPEMLDCLDRLNKDENRVCSELLQEAVRRYFAEKELIRLTGAEKVKNGQLVR